MNWSAELWRVEPDALAPPRELSAAELDQFADRLPSLSVNDDEARGLARQRWLAMVEVSVPPNGLPIIEHQFVFAVESRLRGREPFFFVEGGMIKGWYSTASADTFDQQAVLEFANAVANALGSPADKVGLATVGVWSGTNANGGLPEEDWPDADGSSNT